MRRSISRIIQIPSIFVLCFVSTSGQADAPRKLKSGNYRAGADVRYYSTTANFKTGGGTSKELSNGASLRHIHNEYWAEFGVNPDWRTAAGLSLGWTSANDGRETRDNSGLKELRMQTQYDFEFMDRRLTLIPDGQFVYPLFRVDTGTDSSLIGDGAMELDAGIWATSPLYQLRFLSFIGYRYRDDGRASLSAYRVGIDSQLENWSWLFELRGFDTLTDDSKSNSRSERETVTNRVQGGSLYFYSVNPGLTELAAAGDVAFDSWRVAGELTYAINGDSYSDGWSIMLGLRYAPPLRRRTDHSPESSDDGFRIRAEDNRDEQELFEKSSPVIRKKSERKKKMKKQKPRRKSKSVEQLLKEAEKELEEQ